MCVVGPMASTVDDLTVAYRLMARPDRSDPAQSLFAASQPIEPSARKYIGIYKEWLNQSTPAVLETVQKVIDHLTSKCGYQVAEIDIPFLVEAQMAHVATCLAEGADGACTWAADSTNGLSLLNAPNRITLSVASQTSAIDYLKYAQLRNVVMEHMAYLFGRFQNLLIVTPTSPLPGWPIHEGDQARGFMDGNLSVLNMTYCWLANTTGLPAVTCPAGFVDAEQGEGKLPVGIMAVGKWGAEEQLLGFAKETEEYLNSFYPGGRLRPAEWADVIKLAKERARDGRKD